MNEVAPANAGRKGGRLAYTEETDRKLTRWVREHPDLNPMSGKIWKLAEAEQLTAHGFESMKTRWKTLKMRQALWEAPPP